MIRIKKLIKTIFWKLGGGYQPEKFWDKWAPTFSEDPWQRQEHMQHRWLLKKMKLSKPQSILEVGCGFGRNITFLINQGYNPEIITGTDISSKMIKEAKSYIKNRKVKLIIASAEKLPFADNSFDVVLIHGVFMHIKPDDLIKSFDEINRVTKKYIIQIEQNYPADNDYTFIYDYQKLYDSKKIGIIEYLHKKEIGLDYIYAKVR